MNTPAALVPVAFIDACCLVALLKREVLLACAREGLFQPRWSSHVLDEAEWALTRIGTKIGVKAGADREATAHGATAAAADIRRQLVQDFPEALVDGVPEAADCAAWLAPRFSNRKRILRDDDDLHVLAGGLAAQARFLVTENLRDFPNRALRPVGLRAMNVDRFVGWLADRAPENVLRALHAARHRLEADGRLANPFPLALRQAGLHAALALVGDGPEQERAQCAASVAEPSR